MVSPDGSGGAYTQTTLEPGKTHRLRLINTSVDNHFKVHLDGHPFTIIAADFVPIEPQPVDWLFLAIGQRYDVLITANQTASSYWFRAEVQNQCGANANNGNIKSIFSYSNTTSSIPTSSATTYTQSCSDETGLIPWVSKNVPSAQFAAQNKQLDVQLSAGTNATYSVNGSIVVQWSLDGNLMHVDWEDPTLTYVFSNNNSFSPNQNVIALPNANEFTFWIIQGFIPVPHPIHLHGHDFYLLGSGDGNFSDPTVLNYENPTRRDVAMLPGAGWLVIAFETDNPGAWLMHCHIAWHVSEGLAVQFLEREQDIPDTFSLGDEYYESCQRWDEYYASAPYKQFESGL